MSVLDEVIEIARQDKLQNGYSFFNRPGIIKEARAELLQLRATVEDQAQRIAALEAAVNRVAELLDKHAIDSVRNASIVERVDFALRLLDERTDILINYTTDFAMGDAVRITAQPKPPLEMTDNYLREWGIE